MMCCYVRHIHIYTYMRFQISQRNTSVQSLQLAGQFLYNQLQPSVGEGEVAMKILGIKKHKSGPSVKNIETDVNKDFLERRSLM